MAKRFKEITMQVTVRVPMAFNAAFTRREVKTLINEQCNYSNFADIGDVRVKSIKPISRNR